MGTIRDFTLTGASGSSYTFKAYTMDTQGPLEPLEGVYIYADLAADSSLCTLNYIGITNDIARRHQEHSSYKEGEKDREIIAASNSLLFMWEGSEDARPSIEEDLLLQYHFRFNRQQR
jgi:hypothetical protein